jgi:hypothetical protein
MPSQGERGHRGHLDTQPIGAPTDVPATAPQTGRESPNTALPILRLVLCVVRRDSCAADPLSMGSKRSVIGFLFKVLAHRCLRV